HITLIGPRPCRRLVPFPTRRSAALAAVSKPQRLSCSVSMRRLTALSSTTRTRAPAVLTGSTVFVPRALTTGKGRCTVKTDPLPRSEEHTSELQSRENLVCRLLLEQK